MAQLGWVVRPYYCVLLRKLPKKKVILVRRPDISGRWRWDGECGAAKRIGVTHSSTFIYLAFLTQFQMWNLVKLYIHPHIQEHEHYLKVFELLLWTWRGKTKNPVYIGDVKNVIRYRSNIGYNLQDAGQTHESTHCRQNNEGWPSQSVCRNNFPIVRIHSTGRCSYFDLMVHATDADKSENKYVSFENGVRGVKSKPWVDYVWRIE